MDTLEYTADVLNYFKGNVLLGCICICIPFSSIFEVPIGNAKDNKGTIILHSISMKVV